jgi:hypothetical protein
VTAGIPITQPRSGSYIKGRVKHPFPVAVFARPDQHNAGPPSYDKKIGLVLQGGGALGSYQAGVYEAVASSEYSPDWVAGISIGAYRN